MGLERSVEIEAPAEIDIVDVGVDDRSASHLEFDRHRLVGLCGDKLLISPRDDGYVSERDRPRDPALGVLGLLEKKYMTPRRWRFDAVVNASDIRAGFRRSEERRVGTEWVSTCISRGSPYT